MASDFNTQFVQALYQTLWFRSGSDSDVAIGASLLDAGVLTQSEAIQDFIRATESTNFVLPVIRMYQGFFNRTPDIPGLSAWVNALRNGTTNLSQMAEAFAASPEFANLYGTHPNAVSLVTSLYANVLGRTPDLTSLNIWVSEIQSGSLSLAQVAQDVIQSPEAAEHLGFGIDDWLTAAVTPAESSQAPAYPAIIPIDLLNGGLGTILTTGPDVVFGANGVGGNGIFATIDGSAPTLQGFDIIAPVTGLNATNSLGILSMGSSSSRDVLPAGLVITNVQSIGFTTPGNAGLSANSPFDTSIFLGVETLAIASGGPNGDFIKASTITDVTDTSPGTGGVTVTGGRDVTVTTNGSVAITGASGTVNVTESGTAGGDTISIQGGTTVTITSVGHGETITIGGSGGDPVSGITVYALGGNETVSAPNFAIPVSMTLGTGANLTFGNYVNSSGQATAFLDSISVGSNSTVTLGSIASGTGGNITGEINITVGPNSTVTLGAISAPAGTNTTTETIYLGRDITGATSSGAYTMTTIAGTVHNGGDQVYFGVEDNESFVSTAVNVSAATSFSNALDIAATHDATHGSNVGAFAGVLTWFQYGGNTYIVEAVNNINVAAPHDGLGVNDIVVKLVGLVSIGPNPDFGTSGGLTANTLVI